MKDKIKNHLYLLIPAVLTVIIVLIIYIIKGVYPFGTSNIGYYDMNQSYIPSYARSYEILHGKDSIIFDWLEGAGMDMTSSFQGIFNPLNWPFFFLKPDYVLDAMAWLLMVKLILISLSISYYIKKEYDLPRHISVVFSLVYTFSGFTIQYYTNIHFLEAVIILPLIILALRNMQKNNKTMSYVLLMSWFLALNAYHGFMTLLFVLFYSFGLFFLISDKVKRGAFAAKLGLSTFVSIGIAAVSLVPTIIKWTKLSRTSGLSLDATIFGYSISIFQHQKLFMLFNTEIAVAIFGMLIAGAILKRKKLSREIIFRLYMFSIMLIPVINEGTNLLWHMGSYVHFPYRCAYMLTFAGIELIAYVRNQYSDDPLVLLKTKGVKFAVKMVTGVIALISMVIGIKLYTTFFEYGIIGRVVSYYGLSEMTVLNVAFYVLVICFFNNKVRERVFCIVTMMHLTVASVCFIAPPDYSKEDDFSYYVMRDKYINDSINIRNIVDIENDYVSRIKTLYPCLSRNYAMILGVPSVTQFLAESVAPFFDEIRTLGYDNNFTANLDSGGTYFSDAILNDKKVITYGDVYVPENAYTKCDAVGDYTIYDMNYTLPFGMLTDERIMDVNCEDINAANHQMQVAKAFSDDDIQLFTNVDTSKFELIRSNEEDKEYVYSYRIHADSPSLLYIDTKRSYNVSVNDRKVFFPYFDETDNLQNKKIVKSKLNLISEFERGEEANVEITLDTNKTDQLQLILLDLDVMAKLSEKYEKSSVLSYEVGDNKLVMTADVDGNNYLFLPLEYLEGWHAKVNGNDAEIIPVMNGAFMAVKLPDGRCEINMTFMPPTIIKGAVISLLGLAVAAALFIMKKCRKDIAEIPWIARTASFVFILVAVSALVIMYVLPVFI